MKKVSIILLAIALFAVAAIPLLAEGTYPAWHQLFEQDTAGWIGSDVPGQAGWCGSITRHERGEGPVAPSAGQGYAVVEDGPCNEYWTAEGWVSSGPYASFGGYSTSWPNNGFVTELDIYLDPSWGDDAGFFYYVSMYLLDDGPRYFAIPVAVQNSTVMVAGNPVNSAGWYTFRVRFRDDGGQLAVDFELADRGQLLFAQPVTTTAFTGEATSSFAAANVGTGYSWFHAISEGLQLPIDQHQYRPGR